MNREIVVPGQELKTDEGVVAGQGAYKKGKIVYSSKVGFVEEKGRVIKVVPLTGPYTPAEGDKIIGRIESVKISGWSVDLGVPYKGYLPIGKAVEEYIELPESDLTDYYKVGDYVVARIRAVSKLMRTSLSLEGPEYKKLEGGRIVKMTSWKIPRLIGKKGSMINMIKRLTECEIIIGQNGWIWVRGEPEKELLVAEVIDKIEEESLKKGLTDEIEKMLKGGEDGV